MRKLNIGCGGDYREDYVNLDYDKSNSPDIVFDMNKIYLDKKMPFKDNYFDKIMMYEFLEHMREPLPILQEVYRICKPGGKIIIQSPLGSWGWDCLDHKRQFNWQSFIVHNFDYNETFIKKVEIVEMKRYYLKSRNFIYAIARRIFNKSGIRVVYRKLKKEEWTRLKR